MSSSSSSSCSSIQVRCPICPHNPPITNPEELCGHMSEFHNIHTTMHSNCFESFAHFQIWLSNVEDSRCDAGGYLGSSQGPAYEDEYYLLCRRRPSITTKRRRMSSSDSSNLELNSTVSCTAFVHVFETMDGRITVRYCLDHCGHVEERRSTNLANRSTLKRTSPCATYEYCGDGCDCEQSTSSIASSPASSTSVEFEEEDSSNNNDYKLQDTVISLDAIINQRLDTTADRLKTLTKVLQELAVDIRNTDCQMVI